MTRRILTSLALGTFVAAEAFCADAFFVMRFDDNKPVAQWREVAEIFEENGIRCSFAVNVGSLTDEQAACLRDLAARGHEIMDHTAGHAMYRLRDESGETVLLEPEVDRNDPANTRFKASIRGGRLICADEKAVKRIGYSGKFYAPSVDKVYGLGKTGSWGVLGTAPEWFAADFWGRPITNDVPEQEMIALGRGALKASEKTLRAQAELSRRLFAKHGLPPPRTWIQPGGWETPQASEDLARVYAGYGYRAADCYRGGGPVNWRFQSDFNFFDRNQTVEQVCARVEKAIKAGRPFAYISHQWTNGPGGREEFLRRTRAFAQWLKESGIPCRTYSAIAETVR